MGYLNSIGSYTTHVQKTITDGPSLFLLVLKNKEVSIRISLTRLPIHLLLKDI